MPKHPDTPGSLVSVSWVLSGWSPILPLVDQLIQVGAIEQQLPDFTRVRERNAHTRDNSPSVQFTDFPRADTEIGRRGREIEQARSTGYLNRSSVSFATISATGLTFMGRSRNCARLVPRLRAPEEALIAFSRSPWLTTSGTRDKGWVFQSALGVLHALLPLLRAITSCRYQRVDRTFPQLGRMIAYPPVA